MIEMLKRTAAWLVSDPERAALLVAAVAVAAWKAVPAPLRARLEAAHPRLVGIVRTIVAIAPDVLGAARTAAWQVVRGQPRDLRGDVLTVEPSPDVTAPQRPSVMPPSSGEVQ